jgi:two-component system chemotaxis response regulator CheY
MSRLVLTVDDSRTIREMVSFTIKSIGFSMIEAEDGLKALDLLKITSLISLLVMLICPIWMVSPL